jgi:hypothetical protein
MHSQARHFIRRFKRIGIISGTLLGALSLTASGCQGLNGVALVPGMKQAKQERQILRQAKNDPFATPDDVGYQAASD